uniref:J domain-containing protein n=1 Tax=Aegilops tauschii subsp. strangulata TaxID=200361 RepID=A0A452ZW60_AEGTS
DHYEVLGVPKAATAGDINEAYHKRTALKRKAAERGFDRLTTAHKVLSDPLRRPLYDVHLRAEEKLMGKAPPPAASTGVALGRVVRTCRKSAALGREVAVAGTGGRQNTDRTCGGAKRAGLRSSTGKAGRNGKRSRCLTDGGTYAGLGGATGAHASTAFFSTGRSTFEMSVKYTNEYYNEENSSSFDGEPFCPTDHSTFKTAVKTMNEYYDEDENLGLCVYEVEGVQDDYGNHAGAGNDVTRVCGDLINGDDVEGGTPYAKYDDCGGGDHNYGDHGGAGNNDDTGVCGDYYDDAAGGFDNGYYDGDAGNGADDWW